MTLWLEVLRILKWVIIHSMLLLLLLKFSLFFIKCWLKTKRLILGFKKVPSDFYNFRGGESSFKWIILINIETICGSLLMGKIF